MPQGHVNDCHLLTNARDAIRGFGSTALLKGARRAPCAHHNNGGMHRRRHASACARTADERKMTCPLTPTSPYRTRALVCFQSTRGSSVNRRCSRPPQSRMLQSLTRRSHGCLRGEVLALFSITPAMLSRAMPPSEARGSLAAVQYRWAATMRRLAGCDAMARPPREYPVRGPARLLDH